MRNYFLPFIASAAALALLPAAYAQNPAPAPAAQGARAARQPAAPSPTKNLPFDPHDFSGIWNIHTPRGFSLSVAPPPPMTKWAEDRYALAKPGLGGSGRAAPLGNDPIMVCDPMGFPRIMFWNGYPLEIVQLHDRVLMFFDWFYTYRTIWTDGRALPADPDPRFYGTAVGKWDGDTFVVQSKGFDDRTWLDADGHPHTEDMTVEERYKRVDHDTIEFTMTVTDPKAYTKPWVSDKSTLTLGDNKTVMREDICVPSVEAKYKEEVRNPAGGAGKAK